MSAETSTENKPPARPDKAAKMAVARAAMAVKMPGQSPRARGQEKAAKALLWVYRWGWASPQTLEFLTGAVRSGLGARLVKNKLLQSTKTESGGAVRGIPVYLLTLTQDGRDEVEKHIADPADLLDYETNPYKIDQSKLRHGELAQRATARNLAAGRISGYVTEAMGAAKSAAGVKQHDVIWLLPDGQKHGVEVELSAKWSRKLDEFILSCCLSLQHKRVDQVSIVTDSKAIQHRYKTAFEVGKTFGKWEKNERGFATQTGHYKVPDHIKDKVLCVLLD